MTGGNVLIVDRLLAISVVHVAISVVHVAIDSDFGAIDGTLSCDRASLGMRSCVSWCAIAGVRRGAANTRSAVAGTRSESAG